MNLYHKTKKLILRLVPRSFLFRNEYLFRAFYYLLFIGKKYHCNICGKGLSRFIDLDDDRLCPRCGSLQRTRRLGEILSGEFLESDPRILDFSPSRSIYRVLKKGRYQYTSSDLSGNFLADVKYDITKIDAADHQYDLIICYHILEHIDDDRKAMQELHRVLNAGGSCIIQTPFREGAIYEDPTITSPEEREKHFGQDDHVRIYAVEGLKSRLEGAGFAVDVRTFSESLENDHGFNVEETVLICRKN